MPDPHRRPPAMTPEQLREIMRAAGVTQEKLAQQLGLTQPAVNHWLSGRSPITAKRAAQIRERLGAKPGEQTG